MKEPGLTKESMEGKGDASTMFDWDEGHWWETGMNLIINQVLQVMASPGPGDTDDASPVLHTG